MLNSSLFALRAEAEHMLAKIRVGDHAFECGNASSKRGVNAEVVDMEFGYVVLLEVPRVYALCGRGALRSVTLCPAHRPLFYFVPRALVFERKAPCAARHVAAYKRAAHTFSAARVFPPFARVFAPHALRRPITLVVNKYKRESGATRPVNTWSEADVEAIVSHARSAHGAVVFHRNVAGVGFAPSTSGLPPLRDHEAAARAGATPTSSALQGASSALLNTFQLMLMARAEVVVCTQGAFPTLAAAVGVKKVVTLCKMGRECEDNSYGTPDYVWYYSLSGSSIYTVHDADSAVQVLRMLYGAAAPRGVFVQTLEAHDGDAQATLASAAELLRIRLAFLGTGILFCVARGAAYLRRA